MGGCTDSPVVAACINYGDDGATRIRADFYQNRRPDSDQVYYRVAIHHNIGGRDNGAWVSGFLTIDNTNGRHCCWVRVVDNLPVTYQAKTVVYTHLANKTTVHSVFTSPWVTITS